MTRRQVERMIRHESVITALIGGVLGIALGVALGALLVARVEFIQFSLPVGSLIIFAIAAIFVGIVAAIFPGATKRHAAQRPQSASVRVTARAGRGGTAGRLQRRRRLPVAPIRPDLGRNRHTFGTHGHWWRPDSGGRLDANGEGGEVPNSRHERSERRRAVLPSRRSTIR